jgi:hypothetical protein
VSTGPPGTPASLPSRKADARQPEPHKPKLLDRLREALWARHYSPRTEQTYCHWVRRFIFFPHVRHPAKMVEPENNAFLTHLALKEKVSAFQYDPDLCPRNQQRRWRG